MNKTLIVDASESSRRMMSGLLTKAGHDPIEGGSIEAGKIEATKLPPGAVIVTAMRLRDGTAREFIDWLKTEGYGFPVIAIVEHLNGLDVAEVMRGGGAVDIIQRPAIDKQLIETVELYSGKTNPTLTLGNKLLPRVSETWKKIGSEIEAIASADVNAIVFGECGTGKEQVAQQIHLCSSRNQKPPVVLEAGGAALVGTHKPTSENHEMYDRISGYFRNAAGGTIIIKNVHLLTFEKQSVLLHILSEEHPDVRVICTAEPELLRKVAEKSFRPNLFFTLRQADVAVPSLKETTEDIPVIADFFLKRYAVQTGKLRKKLDESAIKALKHYSWPGNVRELKDILLFAAFHAKTDTITAAELNFNLSEPRMLENLSLNNPELDAQNIMKAYNRAGTWKGAAELLGITERALFERRKKLGIGKSSQYPT